MSLELQLAADIKSAMLAKEKEKLESLRAIKAAILLAKTAEGANGEISDDQITKMIQKLVKQRKESAEIYSTQNRPELAAKETQEAEFMSVYLPKPMTEEELDAALRELIAELGVSQPNEMGKVMGVASKKFAGKADGKAISAKVKELLS